MTGTIVSHFFLRFFQLKIIINFHVAHSSCLVSLGAMGSMAPTDWNPSDIEHMSFIRSEAINDNLALTVSNVPWVTWIDSFKYFIWDFKSSIWKRNKKKQFQIHFKYIEPILSFFWVKVKHSKSSLTQFDTYYMMSNRRWRFCQFLWPS